MPYKSISELPLRFKNMPAKAQKIAMHTINSSLDRGLSEERAFKSAWGAIKKVFTKKEGKWVEMKSEVSFTVYTDEFKAIEEDKEYYVEGTMYLSGVHDAYPNKYGSFDMATPECISDMLTQIKGADVNTIFKVGEDHEQVLKDSRTTPKAKIVDAWIKDNKLVVKSHLNKSHPQFENVWGSIKGKFLDAYSIEFRPVSWKETTVSGKPTRLLEKVQIGGTTFTGKPLNTECTFSDFYCKSLAIEIKEEGTMPEEDDKTDAEKKEEEEKKAQEEKAKKEAEEKAKEEEQKAKAKEEVKSLQDALKESAKEQDALKSQLEEYKSKIPELLKEEIKKLQTENKVITPPEDEIKSMSFYDIIGTRVCTG